MADTNSSSVSSPQRVDMGGIVLAGLGAIAFSGKAIIVKLAFRYGVDAVTLLALRMLVALPLFVMMAIWSSGRATQALSHSDYWKIVVLGVLGYYLASFLDFEGLRYITATLERLILYLTPTIVLLIGVVIFRRRVTRIQIIALLISYAGVTLAFGHDIRVGGSNIALGSLLVFGSALVYAIYLVGSGELVMHVGAVRLTAYAGSVASVFCIAQFFLLRPLDALQLPYQVYVLSLLNGTICTVLPILLVMLAVARIGPALASQVGMIGPVSTIVLSFSLLHEPMEGVQIIGTILVLSGVLMVTRAKA
ncbi:MAG: DMT family transporter [Xanthomonadaceae bacterium]|nr:DMT family transporter [Xanthomonadaceae bacterium]